VARNLRHEQDLHEVLDALADAPVDAVVLKGLPLTRLAYGRLDARRMIDNDILVRRVDVPRAAEALMARGYRPYRGLSVEAALASSKEFALVRDGSVTVDLHWAIADPILHPIDEELVWAHTMEVEVGDRRMRVLDEALTIIHLAYHLAQHGFREERIRQDVAIAWEQWRSVIDRQEFVALAEATGLRPHLACALPSVVRSRRATVVGALVAPVRQSRRHDYAGMLIVASLARPDRAARWFFRAAFPPLPVMSVIYGEPISWRLRRKYLTRPFRPIRRKLDRRRQP
jgi:hypothetical protein